MEAISDCSLSPSVIKSGTIKSFGESFVSAIRLLIAGVARKILFLRCKYIIFLMSDFLMSDIGLFDV
jgi:hypothetical protein